MRGNMKIEIDGKTFVQLSVASSEVGVHEATLRRWGKINQGMMHKLSRTWFIDIAAARELAEARKMFREVRK